MIPTKGELPKHIQDRIDQIEQLWQSDRKNETHAHVRKLYEDAGHHRKVATHCCRFFVMRTQDMDAAIVATRKALKEFRQPHLLTLLCLAHAKKGENDEAVRLSEKYLDDPDLTAAAHLCHGGGLLRRSGEFDPSVEYFKRAAELGELRADRIPASFPIPLGEFEALSRVPDDPGVTPIHFLGSRPAHMKAVTAASCDENYHRLFGGIYRNSFFQHDENPEHILHLHIFDPSDAFLRTMRAEMQADPRLAFSYEHTAKNRGYYYAGRFMQMPRLMAHYRVPIIMTDIDCAFMDTIDEMLTVTAGADIGVVDTERTLFPWRNFLANLIVFNPTEAAARLALAMRNFLLRAPLESFNYWYVDQLAIAQAAYAARNLGMGTVAPVKDEWQRLTYQGSGLSREPERKSARMQERAQDSIERRDRAIKRRESSRES